MGKVLDRITQRLVLYHLDDLPSFREISKIREHLKKAKHHLFARTWLTKQIPNNLKDAQSSLFTKIIATKEIAITTVAFAFYP